MCKNDAVQKPDEASAKIPVADSVVASYAEVKAPAVVVIEDNLVDRMVTRAQLSRFVAALKASPLDSMLKTEQGPFTVFAVLNPTKMALAKDVSVDENANWPASFIIKGEYTTPTIYKSFSSVRPQTTFTTINEKQITMYDLRDTLFFELHPSNTKAFLYSSDLRASNGIVHLLKFVDR
ncbi:MAG: fasciclin domain-containing protein [Gilvibacter sp.]